MSNLPAEADVVEGVMPKAPFTAWSKSGLSDLTDGCSLRTGCT